MIPFIAFAVLIGVTIWALNALLDALRDFDE